MRVRPLESYKLLGTEIELDKNKVYDAVLATNQPDWETKGLIFVGEVLLSRDEYTIESEA